MRHPVGLQGDETLEVQQRLDIALARRVAFKDGAQIRFRLRDDAGLDLIGLLSHLAQAQRPKLLVAELAGDLIGKSIAQVRVAQDDRVQQRGEIGLAVRHMLSLVAHGRPDRGRFGAAHHFQMLGHDPLPRPASRPLTLYSHMVPAAPLVS